MQCLSARLTLVVVVVALASIGSASAQDLSYRVYSNAGGYSVEIPADWSQDPTPKPNIDAHFSSSDHQADIVLRTDDASLAADPQQLITELNSELSQEYPGFVASRPMSDSIPGAELAAISGGTWNEGDTLWVAYVLAASRGTTLYGMKLVATWEYHTANNAQLNHILESYGLVAR